MTFDGSASSDPDVGDTLTYTFGFGDGFAGRAGAAATTTHTYTAPGTYTATLTVRDNHGSSSTAVSQRIDVGNTPPVAMITSPAAGQRLHGGRDGRGLRGSATDAQDGALPASSLTWTVIRHHASHTHPYLGPVSGNASSVVGPAPEDLLAATNSSIEVQLKATDSTGLATVVSQHRAAQDGESFRSMRRRQGSISRSTDRRSRRRRRGRRGRDGT